MNEMNEKTNAADEKNLQRKALLKHLILQLHDGKAPDQIRQRLIELLHKVPYHEVVEVEQQLIAEGLPEAEIQRFCDVHTAVLQGRIEPAPARAVPPGHPVDVFKEENRALERTIDQARALLGEAGSETSKPVAPEYRMALKEVFNALSDVDKHYRRKEYLLFPFLEKHGITGPPKVMWGKHDETRELLKAAHDILGSEGAIECEEFEAAAAGVLEPALAAVEGMIMKEEEILLPMCLDTLTEGEWIQIDQQTPEFGFCLYDPPVAWESGHAIAKNGEAAPLPGRVHLPTGSFSSRELSSLLTHLPLDVTFVDSDDRVRFFSQGTHRIFDRNKAILGRKVQLCHPPASVHVVEQILRDFRSGKASNASFWIRFKGMLVFIEYIALRDEGGDYLGVLECTQDVTRYKQLEGEQRLLSYLAS